MRSTRSGLLFCFFLFNVSGWGQQSQLGSTPPPAAQDPKAVSVLNQALAVSGGTAAVRAIQDYTSSGSITYPLEQDGQGTVTVIGLAGTEFRMDAILPTGTRSFAVNDGVITTKAENGPATSWVPKSTVPSSDAYPYQTPLFPSSLAFPYRQVAAVVNNPIFTLSYKGLAQADGHSAYDIELRRNNTQSASPRVRDIFIDSTSFQIVKVSDSLSTNLSHEVHYSDYRSVGGILMPYLIAEEVAGQQIWAIQLSQISFNTGLQATSFAIK